MKVRNRKVLFSTLIAGFMSVSAPAWAGGTTVHVSLWDKGPDSMGMDGLVHMMGMKDPKPKMAMMGVKIDVSSAKAGDVTFEVKNDSKDTVHEMIVAPVANADTPLPYDKNLEEVDEEAAGSLGEVSELDPGKGGALRLDLKPGEYILFCNVPGHYAAGMWTLLEITS